MSASADAVTDRRMDGQTERQGDGERGETDRETDDRQTHKSKH